MTKYNVLIPVITSNARISIETLSPSAGYARNYRNKHNLWLFNLLIWIGGLQLQPYVADVWLWCRPYRFSSEYEGAHNFARHSLEDRNQRGLPCIPGRCRTIGLYRGA